MNIDKFIDEIEGEVVKEAPQLIPLYESIKGEAQFAYNLYGGALDEVTGDAKILEVGGGAMLLSCYLASLGKNIVSVEPTGEGFSEFAQLREIILRVSPQKPEILEIGIEALRLENAFDFGYSINVMEHVGDVEASLSAVEKSLKAGGVYRFFCPNYLFPYEPHFNIPTLITKRWTKKLFKKRIDNHSMADPEGVWNSLNWITTTQVKRFVCQRDHIILSFNRNIFSDVLMRVLKDPGFAVRRSKFIVGCVNIGVKLRLHKLCKFIPVAFIPVMDCAIYKRMK